MYGVVCSDSVCKFNFCSALSLPPILRRLLLTVDTSALRGRPRKYHLLIPTKLAQKASFEGIPSLKGLFQIFQGLIFPASFLAPQLNNILNMPNCHTKLIMIVHNLVDQKDGCQKDGSFQAFLMKSLSRLFSTHLCRKTNLHLSGIKKFRTNLHLSGIKKFRNLSGHDKLSRKIQPERISNQPSSFWD